MLFTTYAFVLLFLPLALGGTFLYSQDRAPRAWLVRGVVFDTGIRRRSDWSQALSLSN